MAKKDEIERTSIIEKNYKIGQKRSDSEIGQYVEYHDQKSNQTVICQEKMFSDRATLLKEIERVKKKILNKNEYFLNTLDYSVKVQKNWCSTMYLQKIFMEQPKQNLKTEILKSKGRGLGMEELTHLFYHLVYANAVLQQNNLNHGNITPETIFVQQKGQYKLSQGLFQGLSPERINMQKILLNEPIYLSPKVYESLKKRMYQYLNHDECKSDVFSAGLIILEAGLGKSIQDIFFTSQIDQTVLENLLQQFENKFVDNPLLSSSIRKMLEIQEDQRPNFVNLKNAIPEYDIVKKFFQQNNNQEISPQKKQFNESQQENTQDKKYQKSYTHSNAQQYNKKIRPQQTFQNKQQKTTKNVQKYPSQKNLSIYNKNIQQQKMRQLESEKLDHFDFFDVYEHKNQFSGNSTREERTKDNSIQHHHNKQIIDNFFDIQPKSIPFKSKQNHQINNYQHSKIKQQAYQMPQNKLNKSPNYYQRQRPISQNQYQVYNQPRAQNHRPNSQHQYTQHVQRITKESNFFDL